MNKLPFQLLPYMGAVFYGLLDFCRLDYRSCFAFCLPGACYLLLDRLDACLPGFTWVGATTCLRLPPVLHRSLP